MSGIGELIHLHRYLRYLREKGAFMEEQARHQWIAAHVLPHEGEVRGWLRRHVFTLTAADVDDLMQEAYARLWLADFSRIANGRSYFYTVVRNLMVEQARRARIVPMERLGEIELLHVISTDSEPERRASARQDLERLEKIIASLPPQCRRAFELQKLHGLSQREIARAMSITEKTVEKYLARALARVIQAMGDESGYVGKLGTAFETNGYATGRKKD
jgi:RNA polymerase sigma-70 factor (ECF subfamily)